MPRYSSYWAQKSREVGKILFENSLLSVSSIPVITSHVITFMKFRSKRRMLCGEKPIAEARMDEYKMSDVFNFCRALMLDHNHGYQHIRNVFSSVVDYGTYSNLLSDDNRHLNYVLNKTRKHLKTLSKCSLGERKALPIRQIFIDRAPLVIRIIVNFLVATGLRSDSILGLFGSDLKFTRNKLVVSVRRVKCLPNDHNGKILTKCPDGNDCTAPECFIHAGRQTILNHLPLDRETMRSLLDNVSIGLSLHSFRRTLALGTKLLGLELGLKYKEELVKRHFFWERSSAMYGRYTSDSDSFLDSFIPENPMRIWTTPILFVATLFQGEYEKHLGNEGEGTGE